MRTVQEIVSTPQSPTRAFLDKWVHSESWQWQGNALAVEARYLPLIRQMMDADGLIEGLDYYVQ